MKQLYTLLTVFVLISSIKEAKAQTNSNAYFSPNNGQLVDFDGEAIPTIKFKVKTANFNVFIKNDGFSFVADNVIKPAESNQESLLETAIDQQSFLPIGSQVNIHRLDINFLNANKSVVVKGEEAKKEATNFYLANCPKGITTTEKFKKITYKNIYNKIDVECFIDDNKNFKYNLIVNKGGNIEDLKLQYKGADSIKIVKNEVLVYTSLGIFTEKMPEVFYINDSNKKTIVKGVYQLNNNVLSIKVAHALPNQTLIIDPIVSFISYFGGGNSTINQNTGSDGDDYGKGIVIDNSGNIYIVGNTASLNYPTTAGVFMDTIAEWSYLAGLGVSNYYLDIAFVTKFDNNWNIIWSTFYGGGADERGRGIDVDLSGNVVITGNTSSDDLPVLNGAQTTKTGSVGSNTNGFVAHLSNTGTLNWATYFGDNTFGFRNEHGYDVSFDAVGDVYVVGSGTPNTVAPSNIWTLAPPVAAGNTVYLLKYNATGTKIWGKVLGAGNAATGLGVDVDSNDDVVICGRVDVLFPTSGAGSTPLISGQSNAFITKLNPAGTIIWSTCFAGTTTGEAAFDVEFDNNDNVIVAGLSQSTNLPVLNASQPSKGSGGSTGDGFIAKYNSLGIMQWATYYGGSDAEIIQGITSDTKHIYVSGSTQQNHPSTSCAHQPAFAGPVDGGYGDIFVATFDTLGNNLCDSYIGGAGKESFATSGGIATYGGDIYSCAVTETGLPTTSNAINAAYNGGAFDVLLSRVCGNTCGENSITPDFTTLACSGSGKSFFNNATVCDLSGLSWDWTFFGATTTSSTVEDPTGITYPAGGNYNVKLRLTTPCGIDSITKLVTVSSCTPLPISLLYFNATLENENHVKLTWTTVSEINNDFFTIERSIDGVTFEEIITQPGAGNSNVNINYTDVDMSPFNGVSYYRLKQTDFDGKHSFSDIKPIHIKSINITSIYPNPANEKLTIDIASNKDELIYINIVDVLGRNVYNNRFRLKDNSSAYTINTKSFTSGVYTIKITTEKNQFVVKKFVKK